MATNKLGEIVKELRILLAGRSNLLDSIVPPFLFVLINTLLGFGYAMWGSLAIAGIIALLRLRRGQTLWYAVGGIGGVILAILIVRLLGRDEGYFLPNLVVGAATMLACLASVLIRRPIVAFSSYVARRWPLAWYWHPRVRPAYSEVTWLWVAFFGLRFLLQITLFQNQAVGSLAVVNVVAGWPATVVLLAASYLYGTWRLANLKGPSVEEFKAGADPPWEGQKRGF